MNGTGVGNIETNRGPAVLSPADHAINERYFLLLDAKKKESRRLHAIKSTELKNVLIKRTYYTNFGLTLEEYTKDVVDVLLEIDKLSDEKRSEAVNLLAGTKDGFFIYSPREVLDTINGISTSRKERIINKFVGKVAASLEIPTNKKIISPDSEEFNPETASEETALAIINYRPDKKLAEYLASFGEGGSNERSKSPIWFNKTVLKALFKNGYLSSFSRNCSFLKAFNGLDYYFICQFVHEDPKRCDFVERHLQYFSIHEQEYEKVFELLMQHPENYGYLDRNKLFWKGKLSRRVLHDLMNLGERGLTRIEWMLHKGASGNLQDTDILDFFTGVNNEDLRLFRDFHRRNTGINRYQQGY